jgi:predicted PurR-regulated permease PerM
MPEPTPEPPPPASDPVEQRAFLEAEAARQQAETLQKEAEQLKAKNATLKAQVEELKALAARHPEDEPPTDIRRLHLLQIQPVRDVLVILLVLGVFWLGYILRPITVPMLLALTLAYLVEPVVRNVVRRKWMTRMQAAASVILIVLLVITVPLAVGTTVAISQGLSYGSEVEKNVEAIQVLLKDPANEEAKAILRRSRGSGPAWVWLGDFLSGLVHPEPSAEELAKEREAKPDGSAPPPLQSPAPSEPQPKREAPGAPAADSPDLPSSAAPPSREPASTSEAIKPGGSISNKAASWLKGTFENNLQSLGRFVARYLVGTGANALEIGLKTIKAVFYLAFALFLVLFFFFFFCIGYERVTNHIANLIPKWKRNRTLELFRQMDVVIAGFVRGRLIIMGILMVMFTIGYWLIGVPGALIVGPITGVLAVVPYLGMISIPASMLLMWLQPIGPAWQHNWWWIVIAPIALYFIIQTVEDYVLTPMIQGKTTDMDTPSILFAVLAGGILAGFYGVLLAIPAAACIKILLRESFWPRFEAWAEGKVKDFLPISRYDPTEAALSTPPPSDSKG